MDAYRARRIAEHAHGGGRDRFGEPTIDHVRRVVASVSAAARSAAWLHDVLEATGLSRSELRRAGASDLELAAIEMLTRDGDDSRYLEHVSSIALTPGRAGDLAREVKRADLTDRIAQSHRFTACVGAPPYEAALALLDPEARHAHPMQAMRPGGG